MKCVILAGGYGTRLAEETRLIPKPMVEIGGRPIIWHIMKIYAAQGVTEFIICLGYRGYVLKEYFVNYHLHMSDTTVDLATGATEIISSQAEPWKVTLIETGLDTMTGGRLRRVLPHLEGEEAFHLTYGDAVSDVDIAALTRFHQSHGRLATVTAVEPAARFGRLEISADTVTEFTEKPAGESGQINGGFFVLSPEVGRYLGDDSTVWEQAPLQRLAREGNLAAFQHRGFWQPMDTLRDRQELERLWNSGTPPWKLWE